VRPRSLGLIDQRMAEVRKNCFRRARCKSAWGPDGDRRAQSIDVPTGGGGKVGRVFTPLPQRCSKPNAVAPHGLKRLRGGVAIFYEADNMSELELCHDRAFSAARRCGRPIR